jgi:hypothetical protein
VHTHQQTVTLGATYLEAELLLHLPQFGLHAPVLLLHRRLLVADACQQVTAAARRRGRDVWLSSLRLQHMNST